MAPVGRSARYEPGPADSTAHDRILRLFGRFIGAGYAFYTFLLAAAVFELAQITAAWWTMLAVVVIFGSGLGLGASTFLRDVRWTSRLAAVNAVGYLVVVLLWWFAWDGTHLSGQFAAWIAAIPGVASLAAASVWRPAVAFLHMFVAVAAVQVMNHVVRDSPTMDYLVPDLAFGWTFCALFVAAAVMAFRTGRTMDATMAATHAAAASAAAAQAQSVERERFDALVHDTVLSTLLVAARRGDTATVSAQAQRAIEGFDELRAGRGDEEDFNVDQMVAQLRSAASDVDEGVRFLREVDSRCADIEFPAHVVRTLAAALAEAMRNSVFHAGQDARREVAATVEPGRLAVVVADDGIGFDPEKISEVRLGVAVSIRGRMRALEGGSAEVDSRPGFGTRVRLTWARP